MSGHDDIIALHAIGASREFHGYVEELLRRVIADRVPDSGTPVVGLPDINFRRLRTARSKLGLLDIDAVSAVAGPEAAEALRVFRASFEGIDETYGLACGPDRDASGAEVLQEALRAVAAEALDGLMAYWRTVGGLEVPTLATYVGSLAARRENRGPVVPPPTPSRAPIPRIRLPFEGEVTARRARAALGYAFGGLSLAYLDLKRPGGEHTGMIALADLAEVKARVGHHASVVERRRRHDDADIAGVLLGTADGVDALYDAFEAAIAEKGIPVEALGALSETTLDLVRKTGMRLRRVEAIAAERGYALAPEEPAAAPAP